MTRIDALLAAGRTFSYEVFPPKTDEGRRQLDRTVAELAVVAPAFVSVTYGAGGSTRSLTRELVSTIQDGTGTTTMAHLTCVAHTRADLVGLVEEYRDAGVENILALGGDPPADGATGDGATGDNPPGDLAYASDLVELVAGVGGFCVGVAAQPELHPRSPDRVSDRRHLAAKLAMADFAITQFFFEPEPYLTMLDELRARGVDKPVIPGIMPVTNLASVARMAAMSGAAFPAHLHERFEQVADDTEAVRKLGIELAIELSAELLTLGAPGVHVYTLNRPEAALAIHAGIASQLG
jgi:methylenetetrahydrofolate reductase (NADPH)